MSRNSFLESCGPCVWLSWLGMSRNTVNLYQWKTRTADGEKREVEAQLFGGLWQFSSRPSSRRGEGEEWTIHEKPSLEDLEALESMIFNKYQRKHVSYDQLAGVRELIADWKPSFD